MTAVTNFRFSDQTRDLLKKLAEKNDSSQVALLTMLIRQRARQEGLLEPLLKVEPEPSLPKSPAVVR